MDGGVRADGSIVPIHYSSDGSARESESGGSLAGEGRPPAIAPQININVQAMDTRSFLDHSDEIAAAVKQAMLHSHGINDVLGEL